MKPFLQNLAGLLLLFFSAASPAQNPDTERVIRANDSLFWLAYNKCDIDGMHVFVAEDVEFYHDKGGIQKGWRTFEETTKNNLCSKKDWKIRREESKGTVAFYPMESNGKIYGAILSGAHKFFVTENGQPEFWAGIAKFTHLWLLENGSWKMTRILSYDHNAPPYQNQRKSITLRENELKQFQGKYGSKQGVITVALHNGSLSLTLGTTVIPLFAESESVFFDKQRDLTFEFVKSDTKITRLIIRENGAIIEEVPVLK